MHAICNTHAYTIQVNNTCVHACTHYTCIARTHVHMHYACMHVHMHYACMHVHMHYACMHARVHYACMHARAHYACMHARAHYACMHALHMHTRTCTFSYLLVAWRDAAGWNRMPPLNGPRALLCWHLCASRRLTSPFSMGTARCTVTSLYCACR